MRTLKKLDLSDTAVTDEGLAHLKDLTSLQELTVSRTRVTEEGIKAMRQGRPALKVIR